MISEGLFLLCVGMVVVFSFLILLVMIMYLSAWFFDTFSDYFPEPVIEQPPSLKQDQAETAAVLAAVYHYQNRS